MHHPSRLSSPQRALASAVSVLVFTALALPAPSSEACTALRLEGPGGPLIAKNYDWEFGEAKVVANPRGLKKKALGLIPGDKPASWTSRYGSVTFNQYGVEFPNGGMNERGLIVETLWLNGSAFPGSDERPSVNELQWVQYQLDRFATLDEVLDQAPKMRISRVHGDVHYWVCDKSGACAVFEYLDGTLEATTGNALEVPVLTNNPYGQALEHYRRHSAFNEAAPEGTGSLARFTRAAMRRPSGKKSTPKEAFALLDQVTSGDRTQWQIVYAPKAGKITFRTRKASADKTIELRKVAMTCGAERQALDIDLDEGGDVSRRFAALSREDNQTTIAHSLKKTVPALAGRLAPVLAIYPEKLACEKSKR